MGSATCTSVRQRKILAMGTRLAIHILELRILLLPS